MAQVTVTTCSAAFVPTSGASFVASLGGPADLIYISATCSSGLTLTPAEGGSAVAFGNAVIGTVIPFRCTTATFAAGGVVAMRTA